MRNHTILALTLLAVSASAFAAKPKYGPEATTLSHSHEYFKEAGAPDYWAIAPYYVPQQDEKSCSLASVTMVVNAARSQEALTADDKLVTQKELLESVERKFGDKNWGRYLGKLGRGVTLDQLKPLVEESLKAYGIVPGSVEVHHADDTSEKTKAALHQALEENEKSTSDFLIANFVQGAYTGDADVGHIAPVAAYDAKRKRVLVMDPDREWYEPYWISEETFLKGMATQDKVSGKARGYLWIKLALAK